MELLLNLAWVLLATLMLCHWQRSGLRTGSDRRMQIVALAVVLLILFPVISVTDDLQAVQNPAETNCCQRRVHGYAVAHPISSPVAALPAPAFAELSFGILSVAAPGRISAPLVDHPGLAPIQNRPPPVA
jgi:hypothetical protein